MLEVDANEAIRFKLIAPGRGEADASVFEPEMMHQLFGDDEMLKGHEEPSGTIFINHLTFEFAVEFESKSSQPGATKVKELLSANFVEGLLNDKEQLLSSTAHPLPETRKLGQPLTEDKDAAISVHHVQMCQADDDIKGIHRRVQQLLLFFIDGATPIDQTEPEWELFMAIQHVDGVPALIGFCTVYRLFAWPDSSRLRVSQLLVFPPFQRQGVGRLLLEAVYKLADQEGLQDVLYEEPTEEVQVLREKMEVERCAKAPWLKDLAARHGKVSVGMNGSAGTQLPSSLALNCQQLIKAQKELRVPKQQVRRIWEALLMQQKAFQREPGQFPLRGLVARRLVGKYSDTEQQAVSKQIFDFGDGGATFCMRKVPKSEGLKGLPVALEDKVDEGQSKEDRETALELAVEQRMDFLSALAGLVPVDQSCD